MKATYSIIYFLLGMGMVLAAGTSHSVLFKVSLITLIVTTGVAVARYSTISRTIESLKQEGAMWERSGYRRMKIANESKIANIYAGIATISLAVAIASVLFN